MTDAHVKESDTLDPHLKDRLNKESDRPKEGYVFCLACSHVLAHAHDRLNIDGSHEHVFSNPHGFTHHFGCYQEALGCAIEGPPVAADSWFPGYLWRLAMCADCGQHIGWLFEHDDYFYGLLVDKIQTG
jgi:hypothetical protein|tara:strand:- start:16920 stop:17306 length:387 start_codon:yes stop_codon:yes gene_type:complete